MTPTSNIFKTELIKKSAFNRARVTRITTPHGSFMSPAFMPVGTRAFVNHMTPHDLMATHSEIILGGNTYHMLVHPGLETIERLGGMHSMMGWPHSMLTDSGGYQVFSLSQNKKLCKINDEGAHFKHPVSGKIVHLTPASSIHAQKIIGADIIMAFDECTPEAGGRLAALAALERTHRWLLQSKEAHERQPFSAYGYRQALFGIIQGGSFRDLREASTEFILNADLDGIALGGEIIGSNISKTTEILQWIEPVLPDHKTRYTMGVGLNPQDLLDVIAQGVDIFDCVAPTRNARHGALYHGHCVINNNANEKTIRFVSDQENARILIKKSIYAHDERPIIEGCECYTCQHYTRAYLHFLFKQGAHLYGQLACIHNIYVMQNVCRTVQKIIMNEK